MACVLLTVYVSVCVWSNMFIFLFFQIELEKLNNATDEINRLEIELDVSISDTYV